MTKTSKKGINPPAHKPEKGYPGRNVVSHVGCPQEPVAKELIRILKPVNANCPYNVKNSATVTAALKNITLNEDDILVSYDATALYPSIPLQECIQIIMEKVKNDDTLSQRTKLTPDDIETLLNLCLTTSQFVFDGTTYSANDSGPIGLSLMTTVADFWMTHTLEQASKIAT